MDIFQGLHLQNNQCLNTIGYQKYINVYNLINSNFNIDKYFIKKSMFSNHLN